MRHPIKHGELHKKSYEVACKKLEKFYGVDAERFFQARRQSILDKCEDDEFGFAKYFSLKEWHEDLKYQRIGVITK